MYDQGQAVHKSGKGIEGRAHHEEDGALRLCDLWD